MNPLDWIGVALLGGAGAVGRFVLDAEISTRMGREFPYGTLAINLSGAFVLGLLDGIGVTGLASTLFGTAAIGSYTTFSTWMLESHRLREDSEFRPAALNLIVSLTAGLLAAGLGRLLGASL